MGIAASSSKSLFRVDDLGTAVWGQATRLFTANQMQWYSAQVEAGNGSTLNLLQFDHPLSPTARSRAIGDLFYKKTGSGSSMIGWLEVPKGFGFQVSVLRVSCLKI